MLKRPALAIVTLIGVAAVATAWTLAATLPTNEQLRSIGEMSEATTVYDMADRPVFTIFKEYRVEVPLAGISPNLRQAVLAIEDRRFFDHGGIDVIRVVAAALANLRQGRVAQGGSTLTQQLARQAFLSSDKTLRRKLKEALLAVRLERMYTKDELLELYLNKVYFGDGLYGAEAAARGYFGKPASDLTLSESALLAGLVKAPSTTAPTVSLPRALARRDLVLRAMFEQGAIDRADWKRAMQARPVLRDALRRQEPIGQYFKEEVRQLLVERFGWERVSEGGLRVYTTIDPAMQRVAELQVARALARIEALRGARRRMPSGTVDPLQAALVAIDPTTGEVRSMVGGRDFASSPFNRAVQARRQAGSAFKPFVYAAALEAGYTPASTIDRLNDPIRTLQGVWTPEDEHSTDGAMTMRTALRTSSNRAAVRMLEEVGLATTVDSAKRLGIGAVPSVPSLALGSGEVTLLAMTSAYGAFANGGRLEPPTLVRRIEDRNGAVLFEHTRSPRRVLSEATAFLISSMLADVINAGTGARARSEGFRLPAAGKTGTTNDFVDAWFVGFTPRLVTGVWIGFDERRTILPNGFASHLAVPLWAGFMKEATAKHEAVWFQPPSSVTTGTVCRISGALPTAYCDPVEEFFAKGTEPVETCTLHGSRSISTQVAAMFGPQEPEAATLATAGLDSAALPTAPPVVSPATEPRSEATVKKRGFWARLFRRGKAERPSTGDAPAPQQPNPGRN